MSRKVAFVQFGKREAPGRRFAVRGAFALVWMDADGKELARLETSNADRIVAAMEEALRATEAGRRDVIEYALSVRPPTAELRREIEAAAARLEDADPEAREQATTRLATLGHPAYVALLHTKTDSVEARGRIDGILGRLRERHEAVERRGLDHDVEFLSKLGPQYRDRAQARLRAILPEGTDAAGWTAVRGRHRWDATRQKYVPKERD